MLVSKINKPDPITFGSRILTSRIIYNSPKSRSIYNDIKLDNGKQLTIIEQQIDGDTLSKLQYLTSSTGKWIKSRLKLYSNNKVYKVLESFSKVINTLG